MPYRIFLLGKDGHPIRTYEEEHPTDASALAAARAHLGRFQTVEVWDGERLVGCRYSPCDGVSGR